MDEGVGADVVETIRKVGQKMAYEFKPDEVAEWIKVINTVGMEDEQLEPLFVKYIKKN